MAHVTINAFDVSGNKQCDLYDSMIEAPGQAYQPMLVEEINGWKELSFNLPYTIHDDQNFRWNYIKSEYLVRLRIDDDEDWFIIQKPKYSHGKIITNTVTCPHISTQLKTKNLYLVFDDETGIGTIDYQVNRSLTNTGWSLGRCAIFYEADGTTEKIRSLQSDGKKGTYQLITDICNLFKAYPVYHGDTKTVDILALNEKLPELELSVGKNLSSISVEDNSDSLITRLYVEGEYGDFGYVGIDDVNPTGLSYLLNFDYYRSIGLFTSAHEAALATYMTDMPAIVQSIKQKATAINSVEDQINTAWGQIDYVLYLLNNTQITKTIVGGTVSDAQKEFHEGDTLTVLKSTGPYREITVDASAVPAFETTDVYAIKFVTLPNGKIGAQQVSIEAKEKQIESLEKDYAAETDPLKKAAIRDQITQLQTDIQTIYNGDSETVGLYTQMRSTVVLVVTLDTYQGELEDLQSEQGEIEHDFSDAMGDQLKDGYWSDNNYTVGQEESLYRDAVDMMVQLSKPQRTYSISLSFFAEGSDSVVDSFDALSELNWEQENNYSWGTFMHTWVNEGTPQINAKLKLLDQELKINDYAFVSKRTLDLDDPRKDTIEISTSDIALNSTSFESVLSRITELSDQIDQKNTMYDRAKIIDRNGTIGAARLDGAIDVLKNRITSVVSNWYTDNNGALVFEDIRGASAMMLTGEGFMIADGKTQDGEWNWRTCGNGQGQTADAIVTGYLSADRIEAGTITATHLVANIGATIDISDNLTISAIEDGTTAVGHVSTTTVEVDANGIEIKTGGDVYIETGGTFTVQSGNFAIDQYGNVEIAGTITAADGSIGGWNIDAYNLHSGAGNAHVELNTDPTNSYAIWAGADYPSGVPQDAEPGATGNAPFSVTKAGVLHSVSGEIGGWTIALHSLNSGSGVNSVALNTDPNNAYVFWAGGEQPGEQQGNASFSIQKNGALRVRSSGLVKIDSEQDDSYIRFGGTVDDPNFRVGLGGHIIAQSGHFKDLQVDDMTIMQSTDNTGTTKVFVGAVQPTDLSNYLWIKPKAGSGPIVQTDYFGTPTETSMYGTNPVRDVTVSGGGTSWGASEVSYGVKFRIYNYGGTSRYDNMLVQIGRIGDAQKHTIFGPQNMGTFYAGDYVRVDTLNSPKMLPVDLTNATDLIVTISVTKGNTQARLETTPIELQCSAHTSAGNTECEIVWVQ